MTQLLKNGSASAAELNAERSLDFAGPQIRKPWCGLMLVLNKTCGEVIQWGQYCWEGERFKHLGGLLKDVS